MSIPLGTLSAQSVNSGIEAARNLPRLGSPRNQFVCTRVSICFTPMSSSEDEASMSSELSPSESS
eukprot:301960-Lingulodinium_polyedra.AAC.1